MKKCELQVLICTYGADGIRRTARAMHPATEGVEYLVSWQTERGIPVPAELLRGDIKIHTVPGKGLSANRNHALAKATAPLLLLSDDDVDYTESQLQSVITAFEKAPDADILSFRYESADSPKRYPGHSFSLANPPSGYYVSSIELAFRRKSIQGKIWFNENFGIGASFPSGEEEIFLHECLESGLTGKFIPLPIARHDSPTTGSRGRLLPSRPLTKGAVFLRLHPSDWPLRMVIHTIREIPGWIKGEAMSPAVYFRNWLRGVSKARQIHAFPTPDYSKKYLHDR